MLLDLHDMMRIFRKEGILWVEGPWPCLGLLGPEASLVTGFTADGPPSVSYTVTSNQHEKYNNLKQKRESPFWVVMEKNGCAFMLKQEKVLPSTMGD